MASILQGVHVVYLELYDAITWDNMLIYGSMFAVSWVFYKLAIQPCTSPLRKIPSRSRSNLFLGNMGEILGCDAVDPFVKWIREMKTGFFRYHYVLGGQRVLVAEPDAMKRILINNAKNYAKPQFLFRILKTFTGGGLLCLNGVEHMAHRKLCMASFKMTVLKNMVPAMQRHTESLIRLWKSELEENAKIELSIDEHVHRMTMDIISECAFGYDMNALLEPDKPLTKAFKYIMRGFKPSLLRMLLSSIYSSLPFSDNREFKHNLKMSDKLINNIIENKKSQITQYTDQSNCTDQCMDQRTDLLSVLLLARDAETGSGFSAQQLRDHVMTFLFAGHETTSTAICWFLLCVSQRPEIQARVRQEVISELPPKGQNITFEHLEKLMYLTSVIKETMRLYPSVPVTLRQAINDDVVSGYFIPAGTVITLQIGAMHRNPMLWEDPEEFRPERFMTADDIKPYSYLPFLAGSRICIGNKFAMMEMKLILALLLRDLMFQPIPDVAYKKKLRITMKPEPPLKLTAQVV